MKIIPSSLFIFLFFFSISFLQAQSDGQRFMVNGNLTFSRYSPVEVENTTIRRFGIMPSVGYRISGNFYIGAGYDYSHDKRESTTNPLTPGLFPPIIWYSESIIVKNAPFVFAKYLLPLGNRLTGALDVSTTLGNTKTDMTSSGVGFGGGVNEFTTSQEISFAALTFLPELQVKLTRFLSLQAKYRLFEISRNQNSVFPGDAGKSTNYEFSLSPSSLMWGLVFYF
jgi:hypothetical protein